MKRMVGIIAVLVALILGSTLIAWGTDPGQSKELKTTPEQMAEEIAEWQKQLAELVLDLYNPSKIWVRIEHGSVLAVDDQELMRSLKADWAMSRWYQAANERLVGIRNLRIEDKEFFREDLQAYIKVIYARLVEQDKIIRAAKEKDAARLLELIQRLKAKHEEALRQRSAAAPEFKPDTQGDLAASKKAEGLKLDEIRKAGFWHATNHQQAGIAISNSKTFEQLGWAKTLIGEWASYYDAFNAEMARIGAARYPLPGNRIAEESRAKSVRNQSIDAAWARYNAKFKR